MVFAADLAFAMVVFEALHSFHACDAQRGEFSRMRGRPLAPNGGRALYAHGDRFPFRLAYRNRLNLPVPRWKTLQDREGRGYAAKRAFHNPYFHIITSDQKYQWTREDGWHSSVTTDEYHATSEAQEASADEEVHEDNIRPWKSAGSFTGDVRLLCLKKRPTETCAHGIVEVYHKELGAWGVPCSDTWGIGSTNVVCRYLGFRRGKTLKISRGKAPNSVLYSAKFFREISCGGDEWALTECVGEPIQRNYTCRKNRFVAVKCSGFLDDTIADEEVCEGSRMKCKTGDRCIDPTYVCDGMSDCPWGSDEDSCDSANCKKDEYWCGPSGGGCIKNGYLCDGDFDCIDETDEKDCEQFLSAFSKVAGKKSASNSYEAKWENMNPYLCARMCAEETSFTCTSFDFNKNLEMCALSSSTKRVKAAKNWDHYARERQQDCSTAGKYRCRDGTCVRYSNVCDGKRDCSNGEEETECEPLLARLRGGSGAFEGRVEVSKGLRYGMVCDTQWTMKEANVVCRQLGFSRGALQALKGGSFGRSDRKYVLDNVRCTGRESNLDDCRHSRWAVSDCKIDHEAGVVCITDGESTVSQTALEPTAPVITQVSAAGRGDCGVKPTDDEIVVPQARVAGGSGTQPHEWPWQVGIWLPWTYWCGGSLIDPCWVLTAAHCFTREYPLTVYTIRLGDHVTSTDDGTEQNFKIARVIKHSYNTTTKDNDIALIQLQTKQGRCARLTDEVRTICIPRTSTQFEDPTICHITGWGKLSAYSTLPYTPVLQEATVPTIPDPDCELESEYTGMLTKNMVCAGHLSGGIDTCQGDSGGPLSCQDSRSGLYYVWGIVSWGNGCARPKAPGVYVRVGNYIDWIEQNTGINF